MKSNINKSLILIGVLLILGVLCLYHSVPAVLSWGPSQNYQNYSVRTTVNVTQSLPEIINITCSNVNPFTLNAGTTKTLNCTIRIRDYNGGNTINNTNATLYYYLNKSSDPDDNSYHYTNSSCTSSSISGYDANWTCSFNVWYYAYNGTWQINATAKDNYTGKSMAGNGYTNITVAPLYALNVTNIIDFGSVPVGDTSSFMQANVTNFGNMNINVSLYGFGGQNEALYSGYAMICDDRNITSSNERYALNSTATYSSMTSITGAFAPIIGLTIQKQKDIGQLKINSTYWVLYVNESNNPGGVCNGTVVFAAIAP